MRRGCISLGNVECNECHRLIKYPERYLYLEESGKDIALCIDCSKKLGLLKSESSSKKSDELFDLSEE